MRNHLLELSFLVSLIFHSALFFIFNRGDGPKKTAQSIPITLVYAQKERKPLALPIPKPIEPKREIQSPAALPLVKPLEAEESAGPEEDPIEVPTVESPESAMPAVVEKPILGKEGGGGIGGEEREEGYLAPEEPSVFEARDLDEPLKVIKFVQPEYPPLSKDLPGGLILLKILVNQEGEPVKIEILKDELSAFPSFSANAKKAVSKWRFSKPTINRFPVCVWYILPIRFKGSH